jgi:hypothetical protein
VTAPGDVGDLGQTQSRNFLEHRPVLACSEQIADYVRRSSVVLVLAATTAATPARGLVRTGVRVEQRSTAPAIDA